MPRKQNGFGPANSLSFKGAGRVDKGKGVGAFGTYPSNRQYGTSVHRTVKETWNLNSNWMSWRKGYEIYNFASYSLLRIKNTEYNPALPEDEDTNPEYVIAYLKSLLYQGTPYEIQSTFTAYQFPTLNSDTNTHYVVKRFVSPDSKLGTITKVFNDSLEYPEQKQYKEIWCQGIPDPERARLLVQMVNERLTDGETEATLKYVLTENNKPATYLGKTPPDTANLADLDFSQTQITVRVPLDKLNIIENKPGDYIIDQGLSTYTSELTSIDLFADPTALIGKVIYIPSFFIEKSIDQINEINWRDYPYYFGIDVKDSESGVQAFGLDPGLTNLPPSMYDIARLPKIFSTEDATFELSGSYVFLKSQYQRFFGKEYMDATTVKNQVTTCSYAVMPFIVQSSGITNNELVAVSTPYKSDIRLYAPIVTQSNSKGTLIFTDSSFCKYETNDNRFNYDLNTNVNPWQDEVFTSGEPLRPADVYTCDCANYSKSIVAMPEARNDYQTRKTNRQKRYPLPTALSSNRFENLGLDSVSGKITSWESAADRESFKICKHTIAARFVDNVKVIEPSEYPTVEARIVFEDKLQSDMEKLDKYFRLSFQRGELSVAEIVFALSQGLNLDDIETAYVMLNNNNS